MMRMKVAHDDHDDADDVDADDDDEMGMTTTFFFPSRAARRQHKYQYQ